MRSARPTSDGRRRSSYISRKPNAPNFALPMNDAIATRTRRTVNQFTFFNAITSPDLEADVLKSFGSASVDGGGDFDPAELHREVALSEPDGGAVADGVHLPVALVG
jgi:hypothetical protein